MVNEHIVPQAYLRNFAPDEEGLISRYSLIDEHMEEGTIIHHGTDIQFERQLPTKISLTAS